MANFTNTITQADCTLKNLHITYHEIILSGVLPLEIPGYHGSHSPIMLYTLHFMSFYFIYCLLSLLFIRRFFFAVCLEVWSIDYILLISYDRRIGMNMCKATCQWKKLDHPHS